MAEANIRLNSCTKKDSIDFDVHYRRHRNEREVLSHLQKLSEVVDTMGSTIVEYIDGAGVVPARTSKSEPLNEIAGRKSSERLLEMMTEIIHMGRLA